MQVRILQNNVISIYILLLSPDKIPTMGIILLVVVVVVVIVIIITPTLHFAWNKQFLGTPTYISKLDIIPYQVAIARENLELCLSLV